MTEESYQPSKSELKRKAQEVLNQAKKLAKSTLKQIEKLDYPENIKEELRKLHKIKSPQAQARHVKYIAKLLRALEEDN